MPVKKPFIKFNIRSLLPPEKAKAVENIKTTPGDKGANPNINTVISFLMKLPADEIYCPVLQCDVYDYIYKGVGQPLLGSFSIPIGEVQDRIVLNQKKEIEESEFYIRELKKVLENSKMLTDLDRSGPPVRTGDV